MHSLWRRGASPTKVSASQDTPDSKTQSKTWQTGFRFRTAFCHFLSITLFAVAVLSYWPNDWSCLPFQSQSRFRHPPKTLQMPAMLRVGSLNHAKNSVGTNNVIDPGAGDLPLFDMPTRCTTSANTTRATTKKRQFFSWHVFSPGPASGRHLRRSREFVNPVTKEFREFGRDATRKQLATPSHSTHSSGQTPCVDIISQSSSAPAVRKASLRMCCSVKPHQKLLLHRSKWDEHFAIPCDTPGKQHPGMT